MQINTNQKKFYDLNGYVKITNFFSKSEIVVLKKLVDDIQELKPVKGKCMMYIDKVNKMLGMDVTIVTTAKTNEEGKALLEEFGFPFAKK